jgi:hypothetical protein
MRKLVIVAVAALMTSSAANADLVCPKGSLTELLPNLLWQQYAAHNGDYVNSLLRRMSNNLGEVIDARDAQDAEEQMQAAARLGADNAMVMERMFEAGMIAATDIISAYCVPAPDREPWNDAIKRQREKEWCAQWGDAHFCTK